MSKLTDYGMVILAYIAKDPEHVFQASEVAKNTGIARPTVSKLLKIMTKCGFLASHRGVSGGYQLAKPAEAINVVEMLEALEGPLALTECNLIHDHCAVASICQLRTPWQHINQIIYQALAKVTLRDLSHKQSSPGGGSNGISPSSFITRLS